MHSVNIIFIFNEAWSGSTCEHNELSCLVRLDDIHKGNGKRMQSISRTLHSLILSVFIALDAYFRPHVSYIGEKEMLWQTTNRFQATTDWLAGVYLSKHVFSLDHAEYLLMRTKAKRIRKKKKNEKSAICISPRWLLL